MADYVMFLSGSAIGDSSGTRVTGQPTSPNGASSLHLIYPATVAVELAVTITVTTLATPPDLVFWGMIPDLIDNAGNSASQAPTSASNTPPPTPTAGQSTGAATTPTPAPNSPDPPVPSPPPPTTPTPATTTGSPTGPTATVSGPHPPVCGEAKSPTPSPPPPLSSVTCPPPEPPNSAAPSCSPKCFNVCETQVSARWTNLQFKLANATFSTPTSATTSSQEYADGGCTNTNAVTSGGGIVQTTATTRTNPAGTSLSTT